MNIQQINNAQETNFNGHLGFSVKRCIRNRAKADLKRIIELSSHQDKKEIKKLKEKYRDRASLIIKRLKKYCKEHTRRWSILTIVPASSGIKGEKELAFFAPQNRSEKIVRYSKDPQEFTLYEWSQEADDFERLHSGLYKYPPADLPWEEQFRRRNEWEDDQKWFQAHRGHWSDGGY